MGFQPNGKCNLWLQAGAALLETSCPGLTFSMIHCCSSLGILFFFQHDIIHHPDISQTSSGADKVHLSLIPD